MTTKQTITFEAAAKAGMTLGELAAFVQEAMRRDVAPDTRVMSRQKVGGAIRSLTITTVGQS